MKTAIGVPVVTWRPVASSIMTPERIRASSGSRRWVVKREVPGRRRSSSAWRSAASSGRRGGQPSTTQPIPAPWLSPKVVTRKRWPKVLCDMGSWKYIRRARRPSNSVVHMQNRRRIPATLYSLPIHLGGRIASPRQTARVRTTRHGECKMLKTLDRYRDQRRDRSRASRRARPGPTTPAAGAPRPPTDSMAPAKDSMKTHQEAHGQEAPLAKKDEEAAKLPTMRLPPLRPSAPKN